MKNFFKKFKPLPSHLSPLTFPGFTLIELLIAISIIGVLLTSGLIAINPIEQLRKGSDAKRKADLRQLQHALELYYQDNERYPQSSAGDYKILIGTKKLDWGTSWTPYINSVPADPLRANTYVYYSPASSNGQTYYIYANLERGTKDEQACNKGLACVSLTQGVPGFPGDNSCGGVCNYAISSSNVAP